MRLSMRVPTSKKVSIEVLYLKWSNGLLKGVAASFKCTTCRQPLGERMFAVAWVKDHKDQQRSMRVCWDCAKAAEASGSAGVAP